MISSNDIKQIARNLGADLCGIAPADRFAGAPDGFRPTDIYAKCRSVIVFTKRIPSEAMFAQSCVPYTYLNSWVAGEVDRLTVIFALALEDAGIKAVPIPSDDPYEHWEADRSYGRAILSMRHAGYLAGLGVLGKNTLLINKQYGNMIQIGALLVDAELEPDPIATYQACKIECRICLDACPQNALDGVTVDQNLCRPLSNFKNEKGYCLKKCNICRRICPS
ncbi:MAG: 4Fe-4S binding protein [Armatimonadota bacterium]